MGTNTRLSGNSNQSPVPAEPGMGEWHKIEDPAVQWLASKTSGWTANSFSTGASALTVDFSSVVPSGTKAVLVTCGLYTSSAYPTAYWRKNGDTNISTAPSGSSETSHIVGRAEATTNATVYRQVQVDLSTDYKVQFAVSHADMDVYLSYPIKYMI